eukprot:CAMPEP_0181130828 /NCGR_PEP_ID=MMETSP1071-20121207/30077_1 /TAXON_ID=35127 /ORGANISM="Thalassiosira sp., Strain NH16" /LENGTH=992 /DNA_ID=CAMNT_0023216935 /DNA_START=80 /DNA_END=3059 /DNA_ORIENTATION=-
MKAATKTLSSLPLLSILLLLVAIQLQPISSSDATINAAGEVVVDHTDSTAASDDDDHIGEASSSSSSCQPKHFLNGKLSSCDTFQIATLNASPRRCIHVEIPPSSPTKTTDDDDETKKTACIDYENWFDGTNGCSVYGYPQNSDWCERYGSLSTNPQRPTRPGLYGRLGQCPDGSFKIVEVKTRPRFEYSLELTKGCGGMQRVIRGNMMMLEQEFPPGTRVGVKSDDPNVISKYHKVELKKCRGGSKEEQSFTLVPMGGDAAGDSSGGKSEMILIQHKASGIELNMILQGVSGPFFNVTQVYGDGLFEGSGDFFFIKAMATNDDPYDRRMRQRDLPEPMHLASGQFGENEYSEVKLINPIIRQDFTVQEFSMWTFLPVEESNDDGSVAAVDEHSDWLVRMTQLIGIDYLTQLPPWHLLDVDRDSSKSDVKSRFRELSRYFHPDKLLDQNKSEKRELYERIFVLLQGAYDGLKKADGHEKERFKVEAEGSSQLFAHSRYIVELLPFHWSKLDAGNDDDTTTDETGNEGGSGRYVLSAASHLNATLLGNDHIEEESEPTVQLWVTFMYSARCGMSRAIVGMVDLAACHLEKHENIKVGAYGCGMYKEYPLKAGDVTGVRSDPICAQFQRRETPNVHVIVETVPGRKRDENGELVEVHPDPEQIRENAQFKYFYAAVPDGNTTQFFPHHFISFARAGKKVWEDTHLVHKMTKDDFMDPRFVGNVSLVAYLDGTGNYEGGNSEVVDAIATSLPGLARRFLKDGVYVGIAKCGYGDEDIFGIDEDDTNESQKDVDCSTLDVSWLPDIKVYGVDDTVGVSLLRGQFGDVRDVQIALESTGNILRMMLGGTDDDEDEIDELKEEDNEKEEGGESCGQPPPIYEDYDDLDLDKIEGRMEDTPLLDGSEKVDDEIDNDAEAKQELENESKPALDQSKKDKGPRKPKLAGGDSNDDARLAGGREERRAVPDRIAGFQQRQTNRRGGGQIMGGGGVGSAGLLA